MCPFDFRTSFSGLSQGWEMELEWVGVEDSGAVGLVGASSSETNLEGVTSHPRRSPFPALSQAECVHCGELETEGGSPARASGI